MDLAICREIALRNFRELLQSIAWALVLDPAEIPTIRGPAWVRLGLGIGGREDDYRAVGARFDHRWQRLDDAVTTLRRVWAGEPPFEGADPVGPPPIQPGGPPLIAGVMGPKALARAAHWATGVDDASTVTTMNADVLGGVVTRVRDAWRGAGREDRPHVSASLWYALGPGAAGRLRDYVFGYMRLMGDELADAFASSATCSTPDELTRSVEAARDAGCDELFLVPTTADIAELDRTREALGL